VAIVFVKFHFNFDKAQIVIRDLDILRCFNIEGARASLRSRELNIHHETEMSPDVPF
jgi:hypothetical protein